VPAHAATILFRVAQEALTNAIKNGGAKRADVDIRTSNGRVSLTIRDNGSGFDVSQQMALAESKIGLRAMKDMATSMGGDFSVESEPGKGTTVRVILPMESADLESNGSAVRGETTAQSPAILTAAQRAQPEKGGGA
jgi:two-component system NarL family sensor kinase